MHVGTRKARLKFGRALSERIQPRRAIRCIGHLEHTSRMLESCVLGLQLLQASRRHVVGYAERQRGPWNDEQLEK